jgi:hypothetical protein
VHSLCIVAVAGQAVVMSAAILLSDWHRLASAVNGAPVYTRLADKSRNRHRRIIGSSANIRRCVGPVIPHLRTGFL